MSEKSKNLPVVIYVMFGTALIGAVIAIWFYWYKFCEFKSCYVLPNIEQWGQTGDFFGGILNPFFTFIGLIFVIITIKQNQNALEQSENDRKETSVALQVQIETAELQRFENTFFQLIQLHHSIVSSISLLTDNRITGRDALKIAETGNQSQFFKENKYYFNHVYQVVEFVDKSKVSDKCFYVDLFRSQFSLEELDLVLCFFQDNDTDKLLFLCTYEFFEEWDKRNG